MPLRLSFALVLLAACGGSPPPVVEQGPSPEPAPPAHAACAPMGLETPDPLSPPREAERTESGLVSLVLCPGTGTAHPQPRDRVTVHYTGWRHISGERFDSSVERGEPATFPLDRVIPGWTEGVGLMVQGERRRLWIPAELAYGAEPPPGAPAGMLVFDVEVLEITPTVETEVPGTPADVAAPPPEAQRSATGLAWVVLRPGTGTARPGPRDYVTVHYTGWRAADGERFDSSEERGEPTRFPLFGLIPGFSEAVQQMVVGERIRVWIPIELAYQGREGMPEGMLVFEILLVSIG